MKVVVFGAGGHAKVIISTILEAGDSVEGVYDDHAEKHGRKVLGVEVLGPIVEASPFPDVFAILAIGDNRVRHELAQKLLGWQWATIRHPRAYVHTTAKIGRGTAVLAGAIVQPEAEIGDHVIVNTGASVDHDCRIGDFVHLAPGVRLAGEVTVGEGALIGIGASVLPGVRIGAWAVVGAGAVVTEDVAPGITVVGVPARPLEKKQKSL